MKANFAVSLPLAEAASLGAVRRWDDAEICAAGELVWLRVGAADDDRREQCRRLPGADRFTVLDDGRLLPVGALVPVGRLPAGPWLPLAAWLKLELPVADAAAAPPSGARLQLIRSATEREANWLLATFAAWAEYAVGAPQVRLNRWSFAADRAGRVVVRGTPLPPLPGERFVEQEGIALPAGYAWLPALPAETIREAFGLRRDDCLLWASDGRCRTIAADDWVRAARSAVRLTAAELQA